MYTCKICFILLVLSVVPLYAGSFSELLFAPDNITVSAQSRYDRIDGHGTALIQDTGLTTDIAPLLLLHAAVQFDITDTAFRDVLSTWTLRPVRFLTIRTGLHCRYFHTYSVAQFDMFAVADGIIPVGDIFDIVLSAGIAGRYIDLDTRKRRHCNGSQYRRDTFFLWQAAVIFHPASRYSAHISIGNSHAGAPISQGYFQWEISNHFRVSDTVRITVSGGNGFSGVMSIAGIPDRLFIMTGVHFVFPLR